MEENQRWASQTCWSPPCGSILPEGRENALLGTWAGNAPLASSNKSISNLHLPEPSDPHLNILPTQLWHLYLIYSRLGFLKLRTSDILGQTILFCGELFCTMQNVEQHPWSLIKRSQKQPLVVTTKNTPRHCQIPPGEANGPSVENQRYDSHIQGSRSLPSSTSGPACPCKATKPWIRRESSQESLPLGFTVHRYPTFGLTPSRFIPVCPSSSCWSTRARSYSSSSTTAITPAAGAVLPHLGSAEIWGQWWAMLTRRSTTLQSIHLQGRLCIVSGKERFFSAMERETSAGPEDLGNLGVQSSAPPPKISILRLTVPLLPHHGPDFSRSSLSRPCTQLPLQFSHNYDEILGLIFNTVCPPAAGNAAMEFYLSQCVPSWYLANLSLIAPKASKGITRANQFYQASSWPRSTHCSSARVPVPANAFLSTWTSFQPSTGQPDYSVTLEGTRGYQRLTYPQQRGPGCHLRVSDSSLTTLLPGPAF